MSSIINPHIKSIDNKFMHLTNAVKCNLSENVYMYIRIGVKYVIELPDTNEIINVICTGKGFRASDMKILSHVINGAFNPDEEQYTFSYNYESYNKIYFESFKYKQHCNVYISIDDLLI